MLTLKLNTFLKSIYAVKTANILTIIINILVLIVAVLYFLPSIKSFINGSEIKPEQIIFFILFIYFLIESYQLTNLKSEEKEIIKVNKSVDRSENKKSYENLKDTYIFHQKIFYNINEQLKKYDIPQQIKNEVVNEVPQNDIENVIKDEEEANYENIISELSSEEMEAMIQEQEAFLKNNWGSEINEENKEKLDIDFTEDLNKGHNDVSGIIGDEDEELEDMERLNQSMSFTEESPKKEVITGKTKFDKIKPKDISNLL